MPRKLKYANINGYAEPIRYMLHYGKLEFEDVRYYEWPLTKDEKAKFPYGQVPVYEEDGRVLNQSLAIARYVASKVDLLPSDAWEQAKLDAIALTIYDFINKLKPFTMIKDPQKKAESKKEKEEALEFFLSRFEKELKAGNGHFGRKLTWADFILVNAIEILIAIFEEPIDKPYPTITALISKIHAFPGIKDYVAKRGHTLIDYP